ncbi:RNA polymerase sigma-70 factor (ECF subfamily) [Paenibacillus sp. BK033]|uniref:RNA polymerase sigma-70 factor n=1 Tax=Paenibacillus sp. BK033 TaxID=2512133 RepID=UPI0010476669|nr:RNA polymerase sigma-70 factor [Paenibacillus sp. BK033]TCN01392.1 RNA polymerase sigma-70 factor (ECF subfamily) [Paenibacillus sp. BK033]
MSIEELYKRYKTELFSLAYRMLGSVMDAEDIVQDAFLSYNGLSDAGTIRNERAFLYKIVTNRCLDLLRSSAKKREMYVGPWLPEPLLDKGTPDNDPSNKYLRSESISTAYLLLLQQLSATERAVFLLREIFHYSFEEIADMVGKSSTNCRQIFHRAKKSIHFDPDEQPSVSVAEENIKEFVNSLLQGNTAKLLELVSENVVFYSDGGGKVRAAQVPVVGFEQVLKLHQYSINLHGGKITYSFLMVNGLPGILLHSDEGIQYVYSFAYRDHKIEEIYAVANPEKLRHL